MKQIKIVKAYQFLEVLSDNKNLTPKEQWDIYKLRTVLRDHYAFQCEQEEKIRDKYREFANEDGNLKKEKYDELTKDLKTLGEMDVDLGKFTRPKIRMEDGITFRIIEPLEDFVEFLPPEE